MQLDFGLVPQNRQQQDLYQVALQCARSQIYTKCTRCFDCELNIENMGYDPAETKLIKARAKIDAHQKYNTLQMVNSAEKPIIIGVVIAVIVLLAIAYLGNKYGLPGDMTIKGAITATHKILRDVNNDGLLNCIDYAVVFYEVMPNSKIIHTFDYMDFNHLLNRVGTTYVEPQADDGDPFKLWPAFYGALRDDETAKYAKYATRKQW